MTDNNTPNTTQQENSTQPEGNGPAGKMFTQEEVNTIVRERLARERAKGTTTPDAATNVDTDAERKALEADRQQLIKDRQTFECEQYCKENGLDAQVIELLGVDELDAFKKKTEVLSRLFIASNLNSSRCTVRVSSGAEHSTQLGTGYGRDGTEYFKPSMH